MVKFQSAFQKNHIIYYNNNGIEDFSQVKNNLIITLTIK